MIFPDRFTPIERMELLEHWIIVMGYIYYELNDNLASDFKYDANANQLFDLIKQYPEEYKKTKYYNFFTNFEPGCTSSFEIIRRIEREDRDLYWRISANAQTALKCR